VELCSIDVYTFQLTVSVSY